ncbi:hypothetical protein K461DRAFT_315901 [Myriangium duriaei CBS 260.36]|uniref:Rhodopsin domain-containing protein n=1 Tax=Myriangium duriaei CBS 260.36 TaxID=1168546 RepID=A0A9P4IS12_9PEZI|nr:hypothetical protein K461DRAFT_315901 [Myriangium duriaei CBS 260.36]
MTGGPFRYYGGEGPKLLGLTFAMTILGVVLVLLRAYSARSHAGKLRWDFIFVAVGTVFSLACQVTVLLQCMHGVGRHITEIPLDQVWDALYQTWVGLSLGLVGLTFNKLSVVALLLQVTPNIQPKRRTALWIIGIANVVVNAVQIILIWLQCSPVEHVWNRLSPGSCPLANAANNYSYFQGVISVLSDLYLAGYPITVVWSLQLSHRTKVAFCVLMAGGILPAAAGVVRMVYSRRVLSSVDIVHELVPFLMWSDIEMWFVIILGSIPPLRPLFERVILGRVRPASGKVTTTPSFPKTIGSSGNGRRKTADPFALEDYHAEVTVFKVDGNPDDIPLVVRRTSTTEESMEKRPSTGHESELEV